MQRMTAQERLKREAQVKQMVEDGLSINEIAKEVGVTGQSIQKFLKVRGWKTRTIREREGLASAPEEDPAKAERRARRAAMKQTVDRSGSVSQKG